MVHCLTNKINEISAMVEIGKQLRRSLQKEMEKRFEEIENASILAISTLLDPRYKKCLFKNVVVYSNTIKMMQNIYQASVKSQKDAEFNIANDDSVEKLKIRLNK